ncbi:hypothetical protein [Noviherbaspirillum sp.]|uniref:hypothetical protein n=1 Tax=Noviherbaspirillum sp. TaxID=1926288 RepID=UPI002FE09131
MEADRNESLRTTKRPTGDTQSSAKAPGGALVPSPQPQRDASGQNRRNPSLKSKEEHAHIEGWAADLDHANRPAYPMERTPPRLENVHWDRPEDQPVRMKVYHSTERQGITPVFGTSTPPSGLSGKIRDVAYAMTENDIRHWLLLLLADRVNMVEGIGEDLMNGHVPNIFAEMGIKSEWKYNRNGLIRKVAVATAVAGLGYYLLRRRGARWEYKVPKTPL